MSGFVRVGMMLVVQGRVNSLVSLEEEKSLLHVAHYRLSLGLI